MSPTSGPATTSRNSWRGGDHTLGARLARTYAAVAGTVLVGAVVGYPLALLASQQGEGWDGLGYFFVALGGAALLSGLVALGVIWWLDLGWASVLATVAVVLPLGAAAAAGSVAAAGLVLLVWPGVVALLVHGRAVAAAAVALAALLVGGVLTWSVESGRQDRRVESITRDLEQSAVTVYGPPDGADLDWELVMVHQDGDVSYQLRGDGVAYDVSLRREPLREEGEGLGDGELVRVTDGVTLRRGATWIEVIALRPDGTATPAPAPDEAESFARSLVERSPEWLAEQARGTG